MGRRIISPEALETMKGQDTLEGAAIGVQRIDGFWDRVIKNIPGDVVAGWTAILGLFGVSPERSAATAARPTSCGSCGRHWRL